VHPLLLLLLLLLLLPSLLLLLLLPAVLPCLGRTWAMSMAGATCEHSRRQPTWLLHRAWHTRLAFGGGGEGGGQGREGKGWELRVGLTEHFRGSASFKTAANMAASQSVAHQVCVASTGQHSQNVMKGGGAGQRVAMGHCLEGSANFI
jgi:hypothetical protein